MQLAHLALVQLFGDVQAIQQHGRIALGRVAVFVADDAFELAEAHAVLVGHLGFLVDAVALFECGPQRLVAHDHGIDDAVGIESELVLAQHAEFARTHHRSLLRLQLTGKDLHKSGFAGAVRAGESIAPPRRKGHRDFFEQNLRAVAHRYIADTQHVFRFPVRGTAG